MATPDHVDKTLPSTPKPQYTDTPTGRVPTRWLATHADEPRQPTATTPDSEHHAWEAKKHLLDTPSDRLDAPLNDWPPRGDAPGPEEVLIAVSKRGHSYLVHAMRVAGPRKTYRVIGGQESMFPPYTNCRGIHRGSHGCGTMTYC